MGSNRSSEHSKSKDSQFVLPGERLGVIEEFTPNAGTYVKEGVIHSGVVGQVSFDRQNKRVSVYPLVHEALVPKVGTTVLAQVTSAQAENASVRIFKIDDKPISGVFSGILHISDVQQSYVESMSDVCKLSDIIRARVISVKNQDYHLSTKDKDLGVVYAFCSRCGSTLESKRQGMCCPRCGKIERRKTALDYGKGIL